LLSVLFLFSLSLSLSHSLTHSLKMNEVSHQTIINQYKEMCAEVQQIEEKIREHEAEAREHRFVVCWNALSCPFVRLLFCFVQ